MESLVLQSMHSELVKIAASTKEIAEAARRIGATEIGGLRGVKSFLSNPKKYLFAKKKLDESGGGFSTLTKRQRKKYREMRRMLSGHDPLMDEIPYPGMIAVDRRNNLFSRQASSKKSRDVLADIVTLHESGERKISPRDIAPAYYEALGHLNPKAIINDHNLAARLTGPGAEEAVAILRAVREGRGEFPGLREGFSHVYGPRALQFLGPNTKVPKAMRKDYERRVRAAHEAARLEADEINKAIEAARKQIYERIEAQDARVRSRRRARRARLDGLKKTAKAIATKTDPAKWEQAKKDAKDRMGGKHSARAMQLATQLYKKRGGGYSGEKPTAKNNSLKKWTKQKWRWSGEKKAAEGKGVYLPSAKISRLKSTPEGRRLAAAVRKKTEATRKGQQYSSHGLAAGTSLKVKR